MTEAFIGLGSNLGDRVENLATALSLLAETPGVKVLAVSRAYESEPWGVADQPTFANAVAKVRTELYADRFLDVLLQIEDDMGRERAERYGPRVIDLDLLLFGNDEWDSPRLTIPHPRMGEREFVVKPLLDIAPDARYPDGKRVAEERPTEGRIIGELGKVTGFKRVVSECGGGCCGGGGAAVVEEQWVPVMQRAEDDLDPMLSDLTFAGAVLEDAGIPLCFDPLPPEERFQSAMHVKRTFSILVPASYAEDAARLLAEVQAAPAYDADFDESTPDAGDDAQTRRELEEMREQQPWRGDARTMWLPYIVSFAVIIGLALSAFAVSRVPGLARLLGLE